jgi:hypothetical protein
MVGRDKACEEAWIAAHHEWLHRGETERAAGCAFWQGAWALLPGRPGAGDRLGRARCPAVGREPRSRSRNPSTHTPHWPATFEPSHRALPTASAPPRGSRRDLGGARRAR